LHNLGGIEEGNSVAPAAPSLQPSAEGRLVEPYSYGTAEAVPLTKHCHNETLPQQLFAQFGLEI
jgi:hypothetical protein